MEKKERDKDSTGNRGADRSGDNPERKSGRNVKARRKICPFIMDPTLLLDYKNLKVVYRFVSETGRIVPRRVSGVSAKNQRALTRHIKRARNIGLIAPKMD